MLKTGRLPLRSGDQCQSEREWDGGKGKELRVLLFSYQRVQDWQYCGWFCRVRRTIAVQGLSITKHFVLLRANPTYIRCLATYVSAAGDKLALTGSRQR